MGCASSAALPRDPQQAPSPPYIPPENNPRQAPQQGAQQRPNEGLGTLTTAPLVRSLVSLRRDSCNAREPGVLKNPPWRFSQLQTSMI
eukprot:s3237_g1.t1